MPSIEAFGERKPMFEWASDERCVVKYGTLVSRINEGWDPEQALTTPIHQKDRQYTRQPLDITAFGETKSIAEWRDDPRVEVKKNVFLRRIQHGWSPESAFTTPVSAARGRQEEVAPTFEVFGESKSIKEWARDERCTVSEMTLRKNIQSGMPLVEALQFRRRPGRTLSMGKEEIGKEVDDLKSVLKMMGEGGELWLYEAGESRRISLIYNDIRYEVSEETFQDMHEGGLISKTFETDTIKNFELAGTEKDLK